MATTPMQIMKSELTGRFYLVRLGYKPGQAKQDITPQIEEIIHAERERCIQFFFGMVHSHKDSPQLRENIREALN
jgi:hypothetical protein